MRKCGPYLRIEEGEERPVLCNHDDEMDDVEGGQGRDVEVVSASPTHSGRHSTDGGLCSGTSRSAETQVVYTRDGVGVWPAKKQRITGRLSLIKQNSVLFFAWLPYKQAQQLDEGDLGLAQGASDVAANPVAKGQYAVHPIPLSNLKAIRKQTPKLGNHHVVLILKNGLTLPPFYFGSGGVRGLFSVLKQHAVLTKSDGSPGTYLINDTKDPLQRSLATLDLADVLLPPMSQPGQCRPRQPEGEPCSHLPLVDRMREGMQLASQFARDATASFLLQPRQTASRADEGAAEGRQEQKAETGVGLFEMVDRSEPEGMAWGLDQPCPPPLTQDEWFTFLDSSGRIVDDKALRARIFSGGVEPGIRREAWKYLLGMYPRGSTAAYRQALARKRVAEYDRIQAQWTSITERQAARFGKWRERLSRVEKDVRRTDGSHPFFGGEDNPNVASLRRILLTYSMFNFDLGYCQGMSDLASPILYVMRDEAVAFWCFASLMERMEANFHTDCTGMQSQLAALDSLVELADPPLHAFLASKDCTNFFFCYRWLLVHFKREFAFDEVLQLWEALWSCDLTAHFHIYMCAAVLHMHRREILAADMGLDDLLGFCNRLSGNLDLGRTLRAAERLFHAAGLAGQACMAAVEAPLPR